MILSYIEWDFDPIIFEFTLFGKEFPIAWYGFLFALAFLVGQQVFSYIFKKEGKPMKDIETITVYMVLGTVIGARVGHYLFYEWQLLFGDPLDWLINLVIPPFAGLASHGGVLGIIIAMYLYSRKKEDQPFLWVMDRIVIVGNFAGFIRLGNFLNSEIYGVPTDLPWGVKFMSETDPALLPIVPRHPTQLYEFLVNVVLFIATFWLWKKKRNQLPNGFIFFFFAIALFTFRFLIEYVKNNQSLFEAGMSLNMGQVLSLPMIIGGAVCLFLVMKRHKPGQIANS
ncbi:MAG: prolipoprotein diacylglyceryl transferase [Bacteroidota bacterium]